MNDVIKYFYNEKKSTEHERLDAKIPQDLRNFLLRYDVLNPIKDTLNLKVRSNDFFDQGINVFGFNDLKYINGIFNDRVNVEDFIVDENFLVEINTIGTLYVGGNDHNFGKIFYYDYGVIFHEIADSFDSFAEKLYYD